MVVNDAATFPASLALTTRDGNDVELRVAQIRGRLATVFALGAGSWRTDTNHRSRPPDFAVGDSLHRDGEVVAHVRRVRGRLIEIMFASATPLEFVFNYGRPVQYSYLSQELNVWTVQTSYASRPVAAEMPSAGRPLSWSILLAMKRNGILVERLTHAAGLSATGDPALDRELPLEEWYEIPARTSRAISRAKSQGNRIVAVGTSVVRALESAKAATKIRAGEDTTQLRISKSTKLAVVDSLLTGLHETDTSHYELLAAFAPGPRIKDAWSLASEHRFRSHELGELALIAPRLAAPDLAHRSVA